ncbi:hypothetical protein Lalb_Chr16g0382261 [Lupinus albus]|uniref:Uncharacterized protein n=1 Tax=Lupinus albus TaxID=3870 RepID=A0A6A4NTQ5_LUPAL|nr:hypothetical protein Lalb_Chr16g0382261 [Lupinus albus]
MAGALKRCMMLCCTSKIVKIYLYFYVYLENLDNIKDVLIILSNSRNNKIKWMNIII